MLACFFASLVFKKRKELSLRKNCCLTHYFKRNPLLFLISKRNACTQSNIIEMTDSENPGNLMLWLVTVNGLMCTCRYFFPLCNLPFFFFKLFTSGCADLVLLWAGFLLLTATSRGYPLVAACGPVAPGLSGGAQGLLGFSSCSTWPRGCSSSIQNAGPFT